MIRKNIVIPDDLNAKLSREAADRGISQSRLIVLALEHELAERDPVTRWAGVLQLDRPDASATVDDIYDDLD